MKTKKILLIQSIFILSILISSFLNNLITVSILMLQHIFTATSIFVNKNKHTQFKSNWLIVCLIPISFIFMIFSLDFQKYILFISSTFLLVTILDYFIKNIHHWHRIQLILDASIITFIVIGIVGSILYSKLGHQASSSLQWTLMITILSMNLLACIIVLLTVTSITFSKLPKGLTYAIAGIVFFIAYNLTVLLKLYRVVEISEYLAMPFILISFTLFSLGASISSNYSTVSSTTSTNHVHKKLRFAILMILIPLIMYIIGEIQITYLAMISIAIIVYQLLTFYVQKTTMMETMLKKEHKMQSQLEVLVKERTRELEILNDILYEKSTLDPLTGLVNRSYFMQLIDEEIRNGNQNFSVIYMDLDRFKNINDLHGHSMGDILLQMVPSRLRNCSDRRYFLARIGGDEFAMLFYSDLDSDLEDICQNITQSMEKAFLIESFRFHVGISIGIARYPEDGTSVEQLIKYADIAMYHAKKSESKSSSKFVLYSSHLIKQIERRNHIELLLRNTDYDRDFELYYQPKFITSSKELIGFEALVRWHHPTEGFISPAEFIPIAEETGLILELNDWIFENAIKQISYINTTYKKNYVLSLNVSPINLESIHFLPFFVTLITKYQALPQWLELEITERIALNASKQINELLETINKMGILLSIDDFGTGYSTLNYVQQYNIDIIKIAKELIDHIEDDLNKKLLLKAIITMSKALGLKTIAEGVETPEQLQILDELECDAIQGYLLGKPMPYNELSKQYFEV